MQNALKKEETKRNLAYQLSRFGHNSWWYTKLSVSWLFEEPTKAKGTGGVPTKGLFRLNLLLLKLKTENTVAK